MSAYEFSKGHGTENDFVLLPDPDGSVHGDLPDPVVRALCDRRAGIGADGVLRVIRTEALAAYEPAAADLGDGTDWFMDYRNADGSVAQMCGNGVRVFVRYLLDQGLVPVGEPARIGTRAGVREVTAAGELLTVDMGAPQLLGHTEVTVTGAAGGAGAAGALGRTWPARHVDLGNPHAVAFVDDLAEAGTLLQEPTYDTARYPEGVNVEFVVSRGERAVAMRVHERGSGETRSCGTGACAVMVAAAERAGETPEASGADVTWQVQVPGGDLEITWTTRGTVLMTGPAVVHTAGMTGLGRSVAR